MDVSRFRVGDWVLVAAGVVMLVLGLAVHWATIDADGRSFGGARNAFDYFFTGGVAWLLVVAAGVITFLLAARTIQRGSHPMDAADPRRRHAGDAAHAASAMIIGGGADQRIGNQDVTLGRGAGMFIALVAAIAALVGALLNLREEGDSVSAIFSLVLEATLADDGTDTGGDPLPPPTGEVPREPPTSPGR